MKRSSLALLIAEMLIEPRYESALDEAEFILRRIEKKGMLRAFESEEEESNIEEEMKKHYGKFYD